jgi:hypothetical protein
MTNGPPSGQCYSRCYIKARRTDREECVPKYERANRLISEMPVVVGGRSLDAYIVPKGVEAAAMGGVGD